MCIRDRDQIADYAARRDMTIQVAEKWLAANLAYEPASGTSGVRKTRAAWFLNVNPGQRNALLKLNCDALEGKPVI